MRLMQANNVAGDESDSAVRRTRSEPKISAWAPPPRLGGSPPRLLRPNIAVPVSPMHQAIASQFREHPPQVLQVPPLSLGGLVTPGSAHSSPRIEGASLVTVSEPSLPGAAAAPFMGPTRFLTPRLAIGSSTNVAPNVSHPPAGRPTTSRQSLQSRTLEDACTLGHLHMQTLRRVENQLRSELRACRDDLMEAVTAETMKACEALGTRVEKSCKAALKAHSSCFDSRLTDLASVVDTLSASMQKALQSEQKLLQRLDDMLEESIQGKLLQYLDGLREAEKLERWELHETFNRRLDELAGQVKDCFQLSCPLTGRVDDTLTATPPSETTECASQIQMPVPTQEEQWSRSSASALEELSRSSKEWMMRDSSTSSPIPAQKSGSSSATTTSPNASPKEINLEQEQWCRSSVSALEEMSRSRKEIPILVIDKAGKSLSARPAAEVPILVIDKAGKNLSGLPAAEVPILVIDKAGKNLSELPAAVGGQQDQQQQQQQQQQQHQQHPAAATCSTSLIRVEQQQQQQQHQQHPAAATCSTSLIRVGTRADMDALQAPQIRSPRAERKQPKRCSVSSGVPQLHDYSPRQSVPLSARWRTTATMAVATS
eukprot:CAMPEP_0172790804 /NCGR_PEP_ID=MMETSP1074-20121228/208149_1 /TAXON_ID=2916 /ORGANISM="Ceratium fusus, Strain PA161109" /LENGTH=599 /DNA_ID=CAMNT_0013627857 /DNA_START=32 /DNA_END=1831 /DNA_ORIENTATION=+